MALIWMLKKQVHVSSNNFQLMFEIQTISIKGSITIGYCDDYNKM